MPGSRRLQKIDLKLGSTTQWLNVFGMPGMTAYFGLTDIGQAWRHTSCQSANRAAFNLKRSGKSLKRLALAAALLAFDDGAQIVRVHDVAATRQALIIWEAGRAGGAVG